MNEEQQRGWLAALAGKPAGDDAETREARAVREYFSQRIAEETRTAVDPQDEIRMLNHLRGKGAFKAAPPIVPAPSSLRRAWVQLTAPGRTAAWAGAMTMALLAVLVVQAPELREQAAPDRTAAADRHREDATPEMSAPPVPAPPPTSPKTTIGQQLALKSEAVAGPPMAAAKEVRAAADTEADRLRATAAKASPAESMRIAAAPAGLAPPLAPAASPGAANPAPAAPAAAAKAESAAPAAATKPESAGAAAAVNPVPAVPAAANRSTTAPAVAAPAVQSAARSRAPVSLQAVALAVAELFDGSGTVLSDAGRRRLDRFVAEQLDGGAEVRLSGRPGRLATTLEERKAQVEQLKAWMSVVSQYLSAHGVQVTTGLGQSAVLLDGIDDAPDGLPLGSPTLVLRWAPSR
jgi:hypothetical protein